MAHDRTADAAGAGESPATVAPASGDGDRAWGSTRSLMMGVDHANIMSLELIASVLTWAGIGWLVDRWLGTAPWGVAIGALIGNAAGMYLIYVRSGQMEGFRDLPATSARSRAATSTRPPATASATPSRAPGTAVPRNPVVAGSAFATPGHEPAVPTGWTLDGDDTAGVAGASRG